MSGRGHLRGHAPPRLPDPDVAVSCFSPGETEIERPALTLALFFTLTSCGQEEGSFPH